MKLDPVLEEAYRIKDDLARRYGYDVRKLGKAIREEEGKSGRKVVFPPPRQRSG